MDQSSATAREQSAAGFERALRAPTQAQEALLAELLASAAPTEYGQKHRFAEIDGLAAYRRRVPVVGFADLAASVDRMLAGEPDVLVPGRPFFYARTSGTTGRAKHIGYGARVIDEYRDAFAPMLRALERDHPRASMDALFLSGRHDEGVAPDGTRVGSASGFVRNAECFRGESYFHALPEPVFEMVDYDARYYCVLRLALQLPLRTLAALNPSTLLTLFSKAASYCDALVEDLAAGTLAAGPAGAQAMAPQLGASLRRAPEAAARLRAAVAHGTFSPEVAWPTLRVLQTWKGGASANYLRRLRAMCPHATVRPALSGSTEGLLLVPLADDWAGGVPALRSSVLEFFPADAQPTPDAFVPIEALREHVGYRVVLTNSRGLYRYLMDDVFLVEGVHHGVPVLRFSHRYGMTSSLTGEKLTESDVQAGVEAAIRATGFTLVDFQLAPEWDEPPRYLLLVEPAERANEDRATRFLVAFEAGLGAANVEYRDKRASGRLAPPELLCLRPGGFDRMRRALSSAAGRSDAQLKQPRLERRFVDRSALEIDRATPWPGDPSPSSRQRP